MATFTVKKVTSMHYAVVVERKQGPLQVSVPVYEIAGGRDPKFEATMLAKNLNLAMWKSMGGR